MTKMNLTEAKYEANRFRRRRYIPIIGGFLIHLTLGTMQSYGNLVLYTTSYMKVFGNSSFRYKDVSWIYCCAIVTQGIFGFLGGKFERKFGPKLAAIIGGWLMSFGLILSYFTIFNFWLFLFSYGIIAGIGCGLCYSVPLACAIKWMPDSKTVVSGFIFVGRGLSVFICTPLQTYFVNPADLPPSYVPYPQFSNEKYYDDIALLSRIPLLFLYMGIIFAIMQLIGGLFMSNPNKDEIENYYDVHTQLLNEARTGNVTGSGYYSSYDSNSDNCNNMNGNDSNSSIENNSVNININNNKTNSDNKSCNNLEKVLTPSEILNSSYFWYLWIMMHFTWQTVAFIQVYWKMIGSNMINIESDMCLSIIGCFASLTNIFGRIAFGYLGNLCGFKFSMLLMCVLITLFISTLKFVSHGILPFAIWICIIFMTHGGSFAVFPAITADEFGKQNFGPAFGLLFSARAVSSIINSILVSFLADVIGYFGLTLVVSGCTAFSCLLAFLLRPINSPIFE